VKIGDRLRILPFHDRPHALNLWVGEEGVAEKFEIHNDCCATVLLRLDDGVGVWRVLEDVATAALSDEGGDG